MSDKNYELLDSGEGEKLEKFGAVLLRRPDPQAIWEKSLPVEKWEEADGYFTDELKWRFKNEVPAEWPVEIGGIKFNLNLTSFKHTGVFPEHQGNWEWVQKQVNSNTKVLNLFGYTGGYTVAAALSGGDVTHVDASSGAIDKAKENLKLNSPDKNGKGLEARWIQEDCASFVKREERRGNKYDAIILDPPSFGRGNKGEVWKIEEGLLPLLEDCKKLLSDTPAFVLLNGYASGYSEQSYAQILSSTFDLDLKSVEHGQLTIRESCNRGFVLPAGIFARITLRLS